MTVGCRMSWGRKTEGYWRYLVNARSLAICATASSAFLVAGVIGATVATAGSDPSAGANVRVTVDQGGAYVSADQMAGGTYTDGVLSRCGVDRRMQNEPTL